ncbi:hypothetical protein BFU36_12780 [Sulfolobus sp. A20]|uniref:MFS transporter n=1 Tax=Saccharolobus sp. A20 TaxID=1891280 RepID=UPI000845F82C|nr:MFS transporter [Sulfolobus sp. A20]TRM76191.1 MFS transporter [Sulfolobus sp. A20-N-F8]TRM79080.1 MFS transporter [Sulfolobus sp. B5]TRM81745.1 MFS transporter [Sulfolobus sp. D5]TRM83267.1 MFS transporter [Sulfolobus sp. A20-N-F6]TRM85282.1 MFS transporter [Sulfolobus sp. F3]TRM87726.1 MFS transporter [Sulfolobus sp. C3]TRN01881.1 MFS transporter [Sulfolobus sp. E1]
MREVNKNAFLVIGFITMCFNSLYQYTWNILSPMIMIGLNVTLTKVELAFTIFVVISTFSQIVGGYIADTRGPKIIGIVASILSSIGFLLSSFSMNIYMFYIFWSVGSIGEGILYGIASNLAVKWFRDKSGFATGLVTLGFGLGGSIANPIISLSTNFREPMLLIGLVEIIVLPILLSLIKYPSSSSWGLSPKTLIISKKWWILYFSYVMINVPIITLASSLSEIGEGLPRDELILTISLFPLFSGLGRPLLGYVSDKIGRSKSAIIAETLIILGGFMLLGNLISFSIFFIGFFGGSILPIYFSLVGEKFGIKYSTSNNALLYTAKAIVGVLGSLIFSYLFEISKTTSLLYVETCSIIGILLFIIFIYIK